MSALHALLVQGQWALPGGFVDENEPLHAAAARELEEETSVKSSDTNLFQVTLAQQLSDVLHGPCGALGASTCRLHHAAALQNHKTWLANLLMRQPTTHSVQLPRHPAMHMRSLRLRMSRRRWAPLAIRVGTRAAGR